MTAPAKSEPAPTHVYVVRAPNMTPILYLGAIVSMDTRKIAGSDIVIFEVADPSRRTALGKPCTTTAVLGETAFYDEFAALEAAKRLRKRLLSTLKRQHATVDSWRPWRVKSTARKGKRKTA